MKTTPLPKPYFPADTTAAGTVKFCIFFIRLLLYPWLYGFCSGPADLALPSLIGIKLLCLSGVALLLVGVMLILPNLKYLTEEGMRLAFTSGVLSPGTFFFLLNGEPDRGLPAHSDV